MGMIVHQLVCVLKTNIFWIGWIRFTLGFLAMLLPAMAGLWSLKIHNRTAFVFRGLFGATGQFILFVVIAMIGLGRGTVLIYLLGVVGAVTGIPILKERPRPIVGVAVLLATSGVLLSCNAGLPVGWEWLALLGAFFCGITLPIVRLLRRTDSNQVTFLSQGLFGTLILLPMLSWQNVPASGTALGLILTMTVLDIFGQLCMNQGFAKLPVARGSALMMLTPVLSLLAGVTLFAEPLNWRQGLGCGIVLLSSFLAISARKNSTRRQKTLLKTNVQLTTQ